GKGENVKLLLQDSGVSHEYIRPERDQWPALKQQMIDRGCFPGVMPIVELEDGKLYGGTIPAMRVLSRKLGKYLPSDEEDQYMADSVADLSLDWASAITLVFRKIVRLTQEEHQNTVYPIHAGRMDRIYSNREGPFLLGSEVCYTDFLIYHLLQEEGKTAQVSKIDQTEYPHLAKLAQAIESRPNLKEYISSLPAAVAMEDVFK
ncbi:hypothetical protein BCR43DRAFT_434583, partial [Syncephalastrum racemosum]